MYKIKDYSYFKTLRLAHQIGLPSAYFDVKDGYNICIYLYTYQLCIEHWNIWNIHSQHRYVLRHTILISIGNPEETAYVV